MAQIDPQKVKDFLAEAASMDPNAPPPPAADKEVNLDELREELAEKEKEIEEAKANIDETRNKTFEPDKTSLAHLSAWALDIGGTNVEVTAEDKALYIKSLLNDTILELPITLEIGLKMKFRVLTNYDMEIVYLTLDKQARDGLINGPAQYASKVQQCAAALQLINFADLSVPYVHFNDKADSAASIERLQKYIDEVVASWSWVKWQAVVTGLRIFETKLAICNENSRNGNFWNPAGVN